MTLGPPGDNSTTDRDPGRKARRRGRRKVERFDVRPDPTTGHSTRGRPDLGSNSVKSKNDFHTSPKVESDTRGPSHRLGARPFRPRRTPLDPYGTCEPGNFTWSAPEIVWTDLVPRRPGVSTVTTLPSALRERETLLAYTRIRCITF